MIDIAHLPAFFPMGVHPEQVSHILLRIKGGEDQARDELFEALYDDLHDRAENLMRGQPASVTIQATALVHEAYMRLLATHSAPSWEDRKHFLCSVSTAMRHVLVDAARRRTARKRTSPGDRVPLEEVLVQYEERSMDLVALDEIFKDLAKFNPQMSRAAELILFGGASRTEAARVLDVPQRTFERSWKVAKAWIHAQLQ